MASGLLELGYCVINAVGLQNLLVVGIPGEKVGILWFWNDCGRV